MPKKTFFNLPPAKRRRIIDTALDEFASHPYGKASLSRIVARAGIAKGSMYQYFEDKKDLYMYLLDLAANEKLSCIKQELEPGAPFFKAYRQIIMASMRFSLENPRLNNVVANALGPGADAILREFTERWKPVTVDFYRRMLSEGMERGEIRRDIDAGLLSNILFSVGMGLTDHILETLGLTVQGLAAKSDIVQKFTDEKMPGIVDSLLEVLRHGLAAKGGQ